MNQLINPTCEQNVITQEETTRRKFINHEVSVKSIGFLYILGAIILLIAGIIGLGPQNKYPLHIKILICSLYIGIGCFQMCLGRGLRKLSKWSRIPTVILSSIGLLAIPLGTVVNGYILYLLVCEKGTMVFSDEYKSVIRATPHIRYKTPIIIWILLGLLILLVAAAVWGSFITK